MWIWIWINSRVKTLWYIPILKDSLMIQWSQRNAFEYSNSLWKYVFLWLLILDFFLWKMASNWFVFVCTQNVPTWKVAALSKIKLIAYHLLWLIWLLPISNWSFSVLNQFKRIFDFSFFFSMLSVQHSDPIDYSLSITKTHTHGINGKNCFESRKERGSGIW